MRVFLRRGVRFELMGGLALALAFPALGALAQTSTAVATQTTLAAETRDQGGHTRATFHVTVAAKDGQTAKGAVVLRDQGRQIAGAALDASGQAKIALDMTAGAHELVAVYQGDSAHQASTSQVSAISALDSGTADFGVTISPASLSLVAGDSGSITTSITPENAALLKAPMFLTLSCSGIPDQATCTFTPQTIEILPGATTKITSGMVLTTQAASGNAMLRTQPAGGPTALAFLLPGVLALGGLAWGARRRRFLSRLSLMALFALVSVAGVAGCNPQYGYKNHGTPPNPATPAGTYTVLVTAQSSDGVTATTHSTKLAFTVTAK